MKKEKFLLVGINSTLDAVDKMQYFNLNSQYWFQQFLTIFRNIKSGNIYVTQDKDSAWEKTLIKKASKSNLRSLEFRLKLLGDNDFCSWGAKQLDEGKRPGEDFYDLIIRGKIHDNENYNQLKDAISKSLKNDTFKGDYMQEAIVPGTYGNRYDILKNIANIKLESSKNDSKPKLK